MWKMSQYLNDVAAADCTADSAIAAADAADCSCSSLSPLC